MSNIALEIISRKSKSLQVDPEVVLRNKASLESLCDRFIITPVSGFESLVNYSGHSDQPVHRWFRYREGYSLELVRRLLKDAPCGSLVVDPFCGSGTTLVAAQELGCEAYGFEINPLSVLVARVKTASYSEQDVNEIRKARQGLAELTSSALTDEPPALKIIDKVFQPEILESLLRFRRYIKAVDGQRSRDFLMVAWLAILEDVSNVYKEGNGIKYRNRKRIPEGYIRLSDEVWHAALFPEDKAGFIRAKLLKQIDGMLEDLNRRGYAVPPAHVFEVSAEHMTDYLPNNAAAYVLSSPPYCNCFNYFKIFKIELWMGEFVSSYPDLQRLNRRAMRSHVETPLRRETDEQIPVVEEFAVQIDRDKVWDKRIPDAVRGYFIDMKKVLGQVHSILRPSGTSVMVVGNSAYGGIVVPTDALIAHLGTEQGLSVDRIAVARHLTTSSQQRLQLEERKEFLRESLVIMTKSDSRLEEQDIEYVEEIPQHPVCGQEQVYVIRNRGLTEYTHKLHRYPGKFIPHIPRWALQKYCSSSGSIVLDPFCGSGTSLVEAALHGYTGYGVDIDPIARLVSKVKATPIEAQQLQLVIEAVQEQVVATRVGGFKPSIQTLSHWFTDEAINELGIIRDVIDQYRDNQDVYDFLIVCFISIIRRASNADNQTQKTYVSHTHPKIPEPAKEIFLKALADYAARVIRFGEQVATAGGMSEVLPIKDARLLTTSWEKLALPPVSLAVTSPPYVKTVDYVYNQMAEYFWIGDLFGMENQPKQNKYKTQYIGAEKIPKALYEQHILVGIEEIDTLVDVVRAKDKRNGYIVGKYFLDMREHFAQMADILAPGAHYVVVVGDSIVSNESVLTHKLLQLCAREMGYQVENVFGYEIRNRHMRFPRQGRGGIVRYDWVIDFVHRG